MFGLTDVDGDDRGEIKLYAISTCVWCKRTKALLEHLGVRYSYIFVDQLDRETRTEVENEVTKWNPRCSFPTMVIENRKCIVGFQEEEIKEALGHAR
ncbi:MAG: glutaredoxin family protein [Candidatus Thermoplasmatota archaeon]|nr:glutaredoxin family protein [Candidatus Thermoplasmatota archaeon]